MNYTMFQWNEAKIYFRHSVSAELSMHIFVVHILQY